MHVHIQLIVGMIEMKELTELDESEGLGCSFTADELTGGSTPGSLRQYYFKVLWNGVNIYNPTDPDTRESVLTTLAVTPTPTATPTPTTKPPVAPSATITP